MCWYTVSVQYFLRYVYKVTCNSCPLTVRTFLIHKHILFSRLFKMTCFQIEKRVFQLYFLKVRPSHLLSDMCEIYCFCEGENEYCCPL